MQKLTVLIIYCFLFYLANAQNLQLDIHAFKLADFIRLEESLGSTKVENKSHHILEKGVAQPEIYRRKETKVPNLLTYYFYYEKDSSINYILHEWDDTNFTDFKENATKTDKEIASFIEKYNQLYSQISDKYGKSKRKGDRLNISLVPNGLVREDNWKVNDSMEIQLSTALSNKYEKNGPVTINPTYRIRLYIRNIKVDEEAEPMQLSDEKVKALDLVSQGFFSALKSKNLEVAKQYLSVRIVNNVTDTQLEQFAQMIHFDQQLEILFNGVQMGLDGSLLYLIQYKYHNDTNNPPKEMIKVIFDDKDKIAGIQPLKRI